MSEPKRRPIVHAPNCWRQLFRSVANPRRQAVANAPWPPIPTSRRRILGLFVNGLLVLRTPKGAASTALERVHAVEPVPLEPCSPGGLNHLVGAFSAGDTVPLVAASDAVCVSGEQEHRSAGALPGPEMLASPAGLAAFSASGLRGEGQIVAVYERDLLDLEHCWFKDANAAEAGPSHRKVIAYFKRQRSPEMGPPPSNKAHALFVSGILAGKDAAADRHGGGQGVASDAKLVYCDRAIFDSGTDGVPFLDYLVAAAMHGARIFNTSWQHGRNGSYADDACDVDQFMWDHEDCLVVGASGNVGGSLGPPSVAKNGLCVSAAYVGHGDDAGKSWLGDGAFDSAVAIVGGTNDGRRKPDVLAYGCGIRSAALGGDHCRTALDACVVTMPGAPYPPGVPDGMFCASSFATPVIAAAAAIVRQYFGEGWYPAGRRSGSPPRDPSGALLKAVLLNATVATASASDYPDPLLNEGWGLLQLDRALYFDGGRRRLWIEDVWNAGGLTNPACRVYDVTVERNDEPLKVTLVWTEPPTVTCNLSFDDPVVNDLDLEVTAPSGAVYLGNHFRGGESLAGGDEHDRDTRNNVEMALVTRPEPGRWTVAVRARKVNPMDGKGQGFALAVTGAIDVTGVVARSSPDT